MFTIIGGDGKEYGSVTTEDLRKWIAEGRLNAQSLAKAEGDAEFRPLSAFPEFANAFGAGTAGTIASIAPPSMQSAGGREAALQALKGPAIALTVTAILGLILVGLGLVINCLSLAGVQLTHNQALDSQTERLINSFGGGIGIVMDIVGGIVAIIILRGAGKMRRLENHSFAVTASVLAMVPCISPCCLFGLPFGIWALMVLNKPEVKSQFG
jgi:hypothetical protein